MNIGGITGTGGIAKLGPNSTVFKGAIFGD